MCGVRYIGNRPQHIDNLYGTNLVWTPGQVHNVTIKAANQILLHTDVYEIAEEIPDEPPAKGHEDTPAEETPNIHIMPPNLDAMSKADLRLYAQQHYGENLHHAMSEENMRTRIMGFVGERGLR